jgi:hypothetical protein
MRALLSILAAAAPLAAASAEPQGHAAAPQAQAPRVAASTSPSCMPMGVTFAKDVPVATRTQKLGELPPANLYLSVVRLFGGCVAPVMVHSGIGR